jgi:hypothetical protein
MWSILIAFDPNFSKIRIKSNSLWSSVFSFADVAIALSSIGFGSKAYGSFWLDVGFFSCKLLFLRSDSFCSFSAAAFRSLFTSAQMTSSFMSKRFATSGMNTLRVIWSGISETLCVMSLISCAFLIGSFPSLSNKMSALKEMKSCWCSEM